MEDVHKFIRACRWSFWLDFWVDWKRGVAALMQLYDTIANNSNVRLMKAYTLNWNSVTCSLEPGTKEDFQA